MGEQEEEILALESIYENDDKFVLTKTAGVEPSGVFYAPQRLKEPIELIIHKTAEKDGKSPKPVLVTHLSPITLRFAFPWDYPSTQAPDFTLSCHWLSLKQLSKLCQRLDEIWGENEGQVILYNWFSFLEEEALDYLQIDSPLNLSAAVPHGGHHHPKHNHSSRTTSSSCEGGEVLTESGVSDSAAKDEATSASSSRSKAGDEASSASSSRKNNAGGEADRTIGIKESEQGSAKAVASGDETMKGSMDKKGSEQSSTRTVGDASECVNDPKNACTFDMEALSLSKEAEEPSNQRRLSRPDDSPNFLNSIERANKHAPVDKDRDDRVRQDNISPATLLAFLIDINKEKEQEEFDQSTVSCDVCFRERQGKNCMRFSECRHAFCRDCLRGYFSVQIKDGNVKGLTCMMEDCESQALPTQVKELVPAKEYERYDTLLLQSTLDMMQDVCYCPRPQCQHPVIKESNGDMGRCPQCFFVFCTLCKLTYHGRSPCKMKADDLKKLRAEYLSADEETKRFLEKKYGKRAIKQAMEEIHSAEWLEKNAKMCPYCGTQIQKTDGCNKMTCTNCRSYFCWLCHALLSRNNPYSHYGPGSPCNEKLFEGMNMDDEEWWDDDDEDWPEDDDGALIVFVDGI